MKTTLIAFLLAFIPLHAQSADISVSVECRLQRSDSTISAPKVTAADGVPFNMRIGTQVHASYPELTIGVILVGSTEVSGDSIRYDLLMTVRELDNNQTKTEQSIRSFRTKEYLLSGEATSGKDIKIDLGKNESVILKLKIVTPKSKTEANQALQTTTTTVTECAPSSTLRASGGRV